MKIKSFTCGHMDNNAYIVWAEEESRAVIIDAPYDFFDEATAFCKANGLTITALLLTHGHFDHIGDAKKFQNIGAKVFIHAYDADKLSDSAKSLGGAYCKSPEVLPDVTFVTDETLTLAGLKVQVLHTPGHSKGSVCYVINDEAIFSGDTIFRGSFGRTDFYDGDVTEIGASCQKIFDIDRNLPIYTGHGDATSLSFERINNGILFI